MYLVSSKCIILNNPRREVSSPTWLYYRTVPENEKKKSLRSWLTSTSQCKKLKWSPDSKTHVPSHCHYALNYIRFKTGTVKMEKTAIYRIILQNGSNSDFQILAPKQLQKIYYLYCGRIDFLICLSGQVWTMFLPNIDELAMQWQKFVK